jgi:hypothetical protein
VRSWWNPQSIFWFRYNGGLRDWPFGMIHSNTVPLRLFVSSPLAPDAPLRSYIITGKRLHMYSRSSTYQVCDNSQIFFRSCHDAFFQVGNNLEQFFEHCMFAVLSVGRWRTGQLWNSDKRKTTNSALKSSSVASACSTSRMMLWVSNAWILHMAWMVWQK